MAALSATLAAALTVASLSEMPVSVGPSSCEQPILSSAELARLLRLERQHLVGVRRVQVHLSRCRPPEAELVLEWDEGTAVLRVPLATGAALAHRQLAEQAVAEAERRALERLVAPRPAPEPAPPRFEVGLGLGLLTSGEAALIGPSAAFGWRPGEHSLLSIEASYQLRRLTTPIGQIDVDGALLAAHAGWRTSALGLEASLGPQLSAGYAWIRGEPSAHAQSRAEGGPLVLAGLRAGVALPFVLGASCSISAHIDAVLAGISARAAGATVFELSGWAGGLDARIGWRF